MPDVTDGHVVHQYTVRVLGGRRDGTAEALRQRGVQTAVYYPVPVHRLPVYAAQDWGPFPVAERLADEVLSLPMGPDLDPAHVDAVVRAVRDALGERRRGAGRD